MQELGLLARHESRALAGGEMDRGERADGRALDRAGAARHDVDALAAGGEARTGVDPDEPGFAAPLGEHAEQLLRHARRAFDRYPVIGRWIHEDRLGIARLRIGHGPRVHVLPDRLVAVEVALALDVGAAAEHAVLELAFLPECLHAGLYLGLREIARPARAAELQ